MNTLLRWIALGFLGVIGWRKEGEVPEAPKYVLVAAPHTSNWDLPIMLALGFVFRVRPSWMGKHTLFRFPFGTFFRWLGGIAVDRRQPGKAVEQAIRVFNEHESFVLVVAPEGTRKHTVHWKTGFYYIAHGAGVPIVLGFLDYRRKVGGLGPRITPSGDIEADMAAIRHFYADITGKHSGKSSLARVASESSSNPPVSGPDS